jgi:hypothetical protein
VDCDERLAEGHERAVGRSGRVLAQGHDRRDADDANRDEYALDDAGGDVAELEAFVVALEEAKGTTAVPTFAMMSSSSRVAPMKMRVSPPRAPIMKLGSLRSGSYSSTAGMLVTKVVIQATPVMVASLRGGISVGRADAEDRFGED